MCKIWYIKYSCGCTVRQDAPCAETPNTLGTCSRGLEEKDQAFADMRVEWYWQSDGQRHVVKLRP
ncbi:hypothetical protein GGS23DRAFT_595510 [Durotheca rogersii]|uniref:uncharacterized protein n=1 Tax=Durotheca rogersii TaxID=419775 RepID=UPI00222046BF|nr:uncharacterized protein GGS23DRAFT_595510 [Durotheca rogersii]KAI5864817.1 hypothetical protein GGS23DRAFT_595510 [Durotheca rogersii]